MVASKPVTARFLLLAGGLVFAFSALAMMGGVEPFYSAFYSFAWWSYIIATESFLYLRGGRSLLFENPARFLLMLPFSVTIWLIFEALNFRLSNWSYINIPSDLPVRWAGCLIAYSTVLPAIFSTKSLLEYAGVLKESRTQPIKDPKILYGLFLPMLWPRYFFPLVWGAFIFLLEPLNHRLGAPSLLREWGNGSRRTFYLLLISGAFCGFLWEFWNYWAGAKWVYTIPYVGVLKVFEMPVLGFLGFPPFAVECFTMTSALFLLISRIKERYSARNAAALIGAGSLFVLLFDLLVLAGIDRFTILSFRDLSFFPFSVGH